MPKLPNLTNPIAAIRHHLGMKVTEFAKFIGHGAAMIQQVEAGRKPAGDELIDKVCMKTGLPYSLVSKKRFSAADRSSLAKRPRRLPAASKPVDPIRPVFESLVVIPAVLAVAILLHSKSRHAVELANISLGRELGRLVARYDLDHDDVQTLLTEIEDVFAQGQEKTLGQLGLAISESPQYRKLIGANFPS